MSRICTSIDQSNKLIKLGIDVNTADMHYMYRHWEIDENTIGSQSDASIGFDSVFYYGADNSKTYHYIPVWSLSALMDLMPNINGHYPELCRGKLTGEYYMWIEGIFDTQTFNNPIDAAFEMICWFLENKEI